MSWLYSRVLVEAFLEDTSLDGEQSVQSNGSNTQLAYCAPDKMTGFSRLSRFGMTYKPLKENLGEELLTLYLEAFHAPTFPQQEKEQELMEKPLECGEKWRGSFTKYDQVSCSWKTHQCSLLGDLDEFLETWPQWGLMRNGECWEQKTLEQTTRGTEFGLSPNGLDSFHTPNTTGLDGGSNSRKALRKRLMFPTPVKSEGNGSAAFKLTDAVEASMGKTMPKFQKNPDKWQEFQTWPTPVTRDYKDTGTQESMTRALNKRDSPGLALMVGAATGGKLNPMWVEWLMGWPLGWTDLKPLVMDKSPCVQQPLGES
jgi:DNA (cytosine-5)-methyltransferase 1